MDKPVATITYHLKKAVLAAFFFFLLISSSFGQDEKRNIALYPTVGLSLRSGIMNVFNFKPIIPENGMVPYPTEKNVVGLSLNLGVQMLLSDFVILEYYAGLRYDVTHFVSVNKRLSKVYNGVDSVFNVDTKDVKEFIVDNNFNLSIKRKLTYGVGVSIINTGKSYDYVNPTPKTHFIQFSTVNVFIQTPLFKKHIDNLNFEFEVLFMPNGYPYNRQETYMMYSARVFYRFGNILK